jgi:hypothetical protein
VHAPSLLVVGRAAPEEDEDVGAEPREREEQAEDDDNREGAARMVLLHAVGESILLDAQAVRQYEVLNEQTPTGEAIRGDASTAKTKSLISAATCPDARALRLDHAYGSRQSGPERDQSLVHPGSGVDIQAGVSHARRP